MELSEVGFCIGNGLSRLGVDLDALRCFGPVIGCNALYRDWTPDALVCVDGRMIKEAIAGGYNGPLFTARMDYQTKHYTLVNHRTREWIQRYTITRWAGGPVSVAVAHLVFGCSTVFLLGHDFNQSDDGKSKNVYINTENYDKETDPARKQDHLVAAFIRLNRDFRGLKMVWVGPPELQLRALDGHMEWISYDEMRKRLTR